MTVLVQTQMVTQTVGGADRGIGAEILGKYFLLEQTEQRELGLLVISHDTRLLERLCTRMISLS